ncbi:integral peroxisomal membrane peroxin-domain-containing protein [Apodospora peruviana]|uniref:Integral peroxisomal membrane peroxin-domain-containing protein n=1 Tax=Apodospora peruviana TaxID=516989 RepID=A0AAE0IIA4_9PEZI|nr:integral peroxisomal membrane peroxin-domain-containing protein [Apodospora peruviana]
MDLLANELLGTVDEAALQEMYDPESTATATPNNEAAQPEPASGAPDSAKTARSLRRGIFKAASLQDKLLEKLLSQMLPVDDSAETTIPSINASDGTNLNPSDDFANRPGFTVTAMSNNFRRFNARIGVVFRFQNQVLRLLSWRRPSHTLSLLSVYTFICLDPYLICSLPLVCMLLFVLVPSFIARHPPASSDEQQQEHENRVRNLGYSPRGPPLAPARTVKPVKELSRDFFRNMGDLQNVMEDFSVAHDKIIALVVPKTNFSDEALSSAIFVLLFAACCVMSIAAHLVPWRAVALVIGWAGIWAGHPSVGRWIEATKVQYLDSHSSSPKGGDGGGGPVKLAEKTFNSWVRKDIILDEAPETREVEIFELQRLQGGSASGEWEPWLFSPSPYDPLSAGRIAGDRPRGTRFFEDVMAPEGWEWSEKKWALDLWSREWVEERIITGVEVETEGERWVYDIYNEHENYHNSDGGDAMLHSPAGKNRIQGIVNNLSWEEGGGEEDEGAIDRRRGEWRRRRWVRMVKRRNVSGPP